jgi:hypothetical protein
MLETAGQNPGWLSGLCWGHDNSWEVDKTGVCNKTRNIHITQQWGDFTELLLPWKSKKYYIFVCIYPVCYAKAPYFMRPLWFYNIFRHYLINSTIFGKKSLNIKCVFWVSLQVSFETFLILRRNQRDICKNVKTSSLKSTLYFCRILMELEFSQRISEKKSQIWNLIKIRPVGAELFRADIRRVTDGRTWQS